jgi:hypothetical protein
MATVHVMALAGMDMSPALRACPAFDAENWFDQKSAQLLAFVWSCLTELSTMSLENQQEIMSSHYEQLVKELKPEEFPDGTASTSNVEKLLDKMRSTKGNTKRWIDFRTKATRDRSLVRDMLCPKLNKKFPHGLPTSGNQMADVLFSIRQIFWEAKELERIDLAAKRAAKAAARNSEGAKELPRSDAGRSRGSAVVVEMPASYFPKLFCMVCTVVRLFCSPLLARAVAPRRVWLLRADGRRGRQLQNGKDDGRVWRLVQDDISSA